MYRSLVKVFLFVVIVLFLFSCESTNSGNNDMSDSLTGEVIGRSSCKYNKSKEVPDTITCITFTYDSTASELLLNHINAVGNCCLDSFVCSITVLNDTIKIIESAIVETPCDCNCLYDVNMLFKGIEPKKYFIEIRDLAFEMDLINSPDSSYCEVRTYYPYGIDY